MKPIIFRVCFILLSAIVICNGQDYESDLNYYLKNNISNFSPNLLPRTNKNKVIYIDMETMLGQIVAVDTAKQSVKIAAFLQATWEEERLVWDPASFGGVTRLSWDASNLWFPIIIIYNGVGDSQILSSQLPVYLISLSPNKTLVTANWRRELEFSCRFDMSKFPTDEHTCELEFFFSDQGQGNTVVVPRANANFPMNMTALYRENSEWTLLNASTFGVVRKYNLLRGVPTQQSLQMYVIHLEFRRVSTYYILNVITPLLLLTLLQVLVYFVPLECGEKLGFGITIMLSYTVFLLLLDGILPKSQSMPAIASFITAAMILSTVSLLLTSLIMRFHFAPDGTHMPACARVIFVRFLGRIFCVRGAATVHVEPAEKDAAMSESSIRKLDKKEPQPTRSDWVVAAHAIERLMVALGVGATAIVIGVFVLKPILNQ